MFAGPRGRNLTGIAFGIALNDFIKWKLTRIQRRCAVWSR
jgi:hypothetical protein